VLNDPHKIYHWEKEIIKCNVILFKYISFLIYYTCTWSHNDVKKHQHVKVWYALVQNKYLTYCCDITKHIYSNLSFSIYMYAHFWVKRLWLFTLITPSENLSGDHRIDHFSRNYSHKEDEYYRSLTEHSDFFTILLLHYKHSKGFFCIFGLFLDNLHVYIIFFVHFTNFYWYIFEVFMKIRAKTWRAALRKCCYSNAVFKLYDHIIRKVISHFFYSWSM
jgi:hypothetical protein